MLDEGSDLEALVEGVATPDTADGGFAKLRPKLLSAFKFIAQEVTDLVVLYIPPRRNQHIFFGHGLGPKICVSCLEIFVLE